MGHQDALELDSKWASFFLIDSLGVKVWEKGQHIGQQSGQPNGQQNGHGAGLPKIWKDGGLGGRMSIWE